MAFNRTFAGGLRLVFSSKRNAGKIIFIAANRAFLRKARIFLRKGVNNENRSYRNSY